MTLIIGLGNPGEQFKNTRHNIGREIAEVFRKETNLPEFHLKKRGGTEISEGKTGKVPRPAKRAGIPAAEDGLGEKIIILRPNTFMNKSGQAVAPAARFFKIKPKDIFVIHDDADLTLGKAKLSFGRGSAGHKGVESVMRALKTKDFWRFRIGIGGKRDIPAEKLVLRKFTPEETKLIKKVVKRTAWALEKAIKEGPEKAMNDYNK